jgi:hypothetical protein
LDGDDADDDHHNVEKGGAFTDGTGDGAKKGVALKDGRGDGAAGGVGKNAAIGLVILFARYVRAHLLRGLHLGASCSPSALSPVSSTRSPPSVAPSMAGARAQRGCRWRGRARPWLSCLPERRASMAGVRTGVDAVERKSTAMVAVLVGAEAILSHRVANFS